MRLLKEPLLHFLVAGGLLFGLYGLLNPTDEVVTDEASHRIHVTAADIGWLQQAWARQWRRQPSEAELRGIVGDYIREVLLAREAVALGLDRNDTIVQRRLAQKMAFMVEDTVQLVEPDSGTLRLFYEQQPELFMQPARLSFSHVFFNADLRGDRAGADAATALRLAQSGEPAVSGDRFLGDYDFIAVEEADVAAVFGADFARGLFALAPKDGWQGPIRSGYGLHLVSIAQVVQAQLPDFEAVQDEVLQRWRERQERRARDAYFATLLNRYELVLDENVSALVGPLLAVAGTDE